MTDQSGVRTDDLELRACVPRDYEVLLRWLPTADDLHLFTGPTPGWPVTARALRALATGPGRHAFSLVAHQAPDEPLGHAELVVTAPTAHLARVVLAPDHRGRGWASRLVCLIIERAREHAASAMTLNVIETNEPAVRTYRRLGFTPVEQSRPGVVRMSLQLSGAPR